MSKVNIVLTVDYEIFGDGSGDVRKCLIEPANRLLVIANRYNIPLTIMAEICEYWAFKKEEQKGKLPKGYTPARWIEEQLSSSIKANHDVQLHIHPQLVDSVYDQDKNRWKVDLNHWSVSSLSYEEIYGLLKSGKKELEMLLKPLKSDYECFAFRAGAWSIHPEEKILLALKDAGFKVDTTIAPGCSFRSQLGSFNFKRFPQKPYWFVKESLKEETSTGILEFPIYTRKCSLPEKIFYSILRKIRSAGKLPKGFRETVMSKSKMPFIGKLLPSYRMFDFCMMSDKEILDLAVKAEKKFRNYDVIPIVAIGHTKAFNNAKNVESFIAKALDKNYKFVTFKDIIDILNPKRDESKEEKLS